MTDNHRRIAFVMNSLTGEELKAGKRDVSRVYSLLLNPMYGACDKNSPEPIYECNSKTMFYDLFTKTINELKTGDQLIFYFSGHGIEVNDEYCLKVGLNKNDLFSFHSLISELKINSLQKAIIIIDACYSGAVKGVKAPIDTLPFKNKDEIPKGIAVIVSCRDNELSHESDDSSYSVFTDLLCQGIETGLDGKVTDNNLIYIEDIVEYVNHKIINDERYLYKSQHAQYFSKGFERKIWLSYNKTRTDDSSDSNDKNIDARLIKVLKEQSEIIIKEQLEIAIRDQNFEKGSPVNVKNIDDIDEKQLNRMVREQLEIVMREQNLGKDSPVNVKNIDEDHLMRRMRGQLEMRENIVRSLQTLSEEDVDEILGSKILKIVDGKSKFGGALAGFGDAFAKLRNQITFGGKDDAAKIFFDGFSFYVYYYMIIIQDDISFSSSDALLPVDLKQSKFDYVSQFKEIINELDAKIKGYKSINRTLHVTIDKEKMLDICCFIRVIDSKRTYFILSQEPSSFFKEQVDRILLRRYKDIGDMAKKFEELSEHYTIPKVDIAIFNSNGFELPSDDGQSVVISKIGEKYLSAENEQELLILLDDIGKFFDKKQSLFNRNKEYSGNRGVWYYWATYNKKYLAVKMLEPLSDKDREKFCGYVEKNIWNNLVNTKSLSEMQDWLNTFTQRDSGVLANNPTLFSKIRILYNALVFVSILLLFIAIGIYFRYPNWLLPDLRFEVNEIRKQYETEYNSHKDELNRLKSKFDDTSKIFKEELKDISKQSSAKLELSDDCYEPFKFSYRMIQLSENDYARLRRIAKNMINIQNNCKIIITICNNVDENLNSERAKNIRAFLIKEGVPEFSVIISDEIEKTILSGVRLKLML